MKLTTPQIVWHGKEPVFSADFHHSGDLWRLATGGADKDVKVEATHTITHVCMETHSVCGVYVCVCVCGVCVDMEAGEGGGG